MVIIDLPDQPIYALGDLHGAWDRLKYEIENRSLSDCAFIICGDIGIGFENKKVEEKKLKEVNEFLKKRNLNFICLRGNHDDPSYFNRKIEDTNKETDFWYSNIKLVPDYTVLRINGKSILMVGGATSIDRMARKLHYDSNIKNFMETYPNLTEEIVKSILMPSYWESEQPYLDTDAIEKLTKDGILITHVLTHTCPSFCFPLTKNGVEEHLKIDEKLEFDLDKERSTMDALYNILLDNFHPIEEWVYGHYHAHVQEDIKGIRFTTLLNSDKTFDAYEITRLDLDQIGI